jgi:hypothetical protein
MANKHPSFKSGIEDNFRGLIGKVFFESDADIQGFTNDGEKIIGEFKSEAEHKNNYSWWSDWRWRLENIYSNNLSSMLPRNKRWIAAVDGQLRDYCQIENTNIGYLVIENYAPIDSDIIEALDFLVSEGRINGYLNPTSDSQGFGYYKINFN